MNALLSKPNTEHPVRDAASVWMRYEKNSASGPFSESLQLILEAIRRDQACDAVSLYEFSNPRMLVLRESAGTHTGRREAANVQLSARSSEWLRSLTQIEEIPSAHQDLRVNDFPEVLLHRIKTITVVPVRREGLPLAVITLGWMAARPETLLPASGSLQALIDCISRLVVTREQASAALHLACEIARLETGLADLKIAERASGLIDGAHWTQHTPFAIQEHVLRVLEHADINRNLREQLAILQSRVETRQLVTSAKARVQTALGINEESAYLYLRNASRRTRRPLRDIAEKVLSGNDLPESPESII